MAAFVIRWLVTTIAVLVAAHIIPGISYDGWGALLGACLLLGIINAFVRPVLLLLSLPFIIVTMGLFHLRHQRAAAAAGFEDRAGVPRRRFLERVFWRDHHQCYQLDTEFLFPRQRREDSRDHSPCGGEAGQRAGDRMTYCLSLHCREGLVFLSDTRTSAGVDNVTTHSKMRVYGVKGQRVLCLLTSGNLSVTQSVTAYVNRDLEKAKENPNLSCLLNQADLFETVHYLGQRIREVWRLDAQALDRAGISFNSNFILGGQIAGQSPEIYQIYPEGNAIHSSRESPFLQIGELKYGKPILDRGFSYETPLCEAVKFGLLSLDATAKSNLSVGTPFEMFAYKADSLEVRHRMKFEENDPYLRTVRERWQEGLIQLVRDIPELDVLAE